MELGDFVNFADLLKKDRTHGKNWIPRKRGKKRILVLWLTPFIKWTWYREYFHWPAWLSVWLCSLPAFVHLLVSRIWETEKSPWSLSYWKQCYWHSHTKSKTKQILWGKSTLSQLKPGIYLRYYI